VVGAEAAFNLLAETVEDLGLTRRGEDGAVLLTGVAADLGGEIGALGQELDDLIVKAFEALAEG
jgi:hypothetical protein